jgi:hypothetical protein
MKNQLIRALYALSALTLAGATSVALAAAPIADWTFSEAAGKTLNLSANTGSGVGGAGGTWDVAIAGVLTDGSGLLNVRNTGAGGSGTRTTYADFGPYPGAVTSGTWSLYATFASWNLAGAGAGGASAPSFDLALIEGNSFETAGFTLAAGPNGVTLGAGVDASGDGSNLAAAASFAAIVSQPVTVRLTVDLGALGYALAYDSGSGWVTVGGASIDSLTAGMNSLRLSLNGDFTVGNQAGRGLVVDRIWVVAAEVPEAAPTSLWAAGLLVIGFMAARRRR